MSRPRYRWNHRCHCWEFFDGLSWGLSFNLMGKSSDDLRTARALGEVVAYDDTRHEPTK